MRLYTIGESCAPPPPPAPALNNHRLFTLNGSGTSILV